MLLVINILLFLVIVFIIGSKISEKNILNIDKNDIEEKIELLKTDVRLASMETRIDSPNVIKETREHQEFNQKILINAIYHNVLNKSQKILNDETIHKITCSFLTITKIGTISKYRKYSNKLQYYSTNIEMTKQIEKEIHLFLDPVKQADIIGFFQEIIYYNDIQVELTFENKERKKYIIKNIIKDTQNIDKEDVMDTEIVLESSEDMDIITNFNLSYVEGTFSVFNTKQLHIESDDYNLLNYKVFYE